MRPRTVFRTSRVVRDAAKLNQLAARPLPLDEPLVELVIEGDLMGGAEFNGERGDEDDGR